MREEHGRCRLTRRPVRTPERTRRRAFGWVVGIDAVALVVAALGFASPTRAQEIPDALPAPEEDPRKGPRLEYTRGPVQCLTERGFRSEVAIALDGADHLAADSLDVVRVAFETSPGGFKGTLVYTDALGHQRAPEVLTSSNCEALGRWFARVVKRLVPKAPVPDDPPPPEPCPTCPAPSCPVCSCPACAVRGTQPPFADFLVLKPPPWNMDVTVGFSTYLMMTSFLTADVGPAVGVAAEVGGEIVFVRLEFRGALPSRAYAHERIPGATSSFPVEFDLSQVTALVVPCGRWKYFVGCGVAQFGVFVMNYPVGQSMSAAYGLGPRLGVEVPFAERFSVFGFGEVLFTPSQAIFQFDLPNPDYPDAPLANSRWVQPVASGFFGVGLSVKFK